MFSNELTFLLLLWLVKNIVCSFSFTQLDPDNPERKFSFELDATNDEETWSVVELDPPGMISEDLLEQLLVPLNETNDMISFVQGMRNSFLERL